MRNSNQKSETSACYKCMQQCPISELTQRGDEDWSYLVCQDCLADKPVHAQPEIPFCLWDESEEWGNA